MTRAGGDNAISVPQQPKVMKNRGLGGKHPFEKAGRVTWSREPKVVELGLHPPHCTNATKPPQRTPKFFSSIQFSAGWGQGSLPTHSTHTSGVKGLAGSSRWKLQEHLCR